MRWMIVAIAGLLAAGIAFKWTHPRGAATGVAAAKSPSWQRRQMEESLANMNRRMPIQVSPAVRIDRMEMLNDVALVIVTQQGIFEPTDDAKAAFMKLMKADYCHGKLKPAYDNGVSVEIDLKTPSRNLDEPFGKTWVASISPAQCG